MSQFTANFPLRAKKPEALVFACIDYRFREPIQQFVKDNLGIHDFDLKTDAGSVQQINVGTYEVRRWIIKNFKIAIEHHKIGEIVMFVHFDCAAYGGSAKFGGHETELKSLTEEMSKAIKAIRSECSEVKISGYVAVLEDSIIGILPVEV